MVLRLAGLAAALLIAGCTSSAEPTPAAPSVAAPQLVSPAERQALFGDLHLHTSYSLDAWTRYGARTTPDEAYRFGRGETIDYFGRKVRRAEPLDFMAVTDHAELLGVGVDLEDPAAPLWASPLGQLFRADPAAGMKAVYQLFMQFGVQRRPGGVDPGPGMQNAWRREVAAANANYRPGRFTTFIGYEWTSTPQTLYNLHRNVLFQGDAAPFPFTSDDSEKPEDLWSYLDGVRAQGFEVMAIPHNSNASNGLMFDWVMSDGRPIDEAYAQRRAMNEPLVEVFQVKGQSETAPELSGADELAGFEVLDTLLVKPVKVKKPGGYARDAVGRGLDIQERVGANPFKFGFVGGTDIHNGLSTSAENAIAGAGSGVDPDSNLPGRERSRALLHLEGAGAPGPGAPGDPPVTHFTVASGGLTGVWAEENTRASIFQALRRRETFATSGPRLKIRFFGGWTYDRRLLDRRDWTRLAYAQGVPMGADLPPPPQGRRGPPRFVVWALKDPNGGNLDRVQVVKVWLAGGRRRERVFDVAWSGERRADPSTGRVGPVKSTVDVGSATYANSVGAVELKAVWSDPEFDPAQLAVYYARAVEIPTPRWSTILAARHRLPIPKDAPATIQERALSSPIWYSPARS